MDRELDMLIQELKCLTEVLTTDEAERLVRTIMSDEEIISLAEELKERRNENEKDIRL